MTGHRLPDGGARIDRTRPIRFTFNGRTLMGYQGDTLASALLANGIGIVGRSFKLHRPRGIVASGFEETNALVELGEGAWTSPNVPATLVPLSDGLVARSVNAWPSPKFDLGAVNNLLRGVLSAGFYYKTFMWPNWHWYEGLIRRAAGLGRAVHAVDPQSYKALNHHCDVLVIGASSQGKMAAEAAARKGRSVILLDARDFAHCSKGVLSFERTFALGIWDHRLVLASQAGRVLHRIRAGEIVLSTGRFERMIAFANNDLPGIMLSGAVRDYVRDFAAAPGRNGVFFVNNDAGWEAAIATANSGIKVCAIIDARDGCKEGLVAQARQLGIEVCLASRVIKAHGARAVKAVSVRTRAADRHFNCDFLGVAGGWNPATQLWAMAGGTSRFDPASQSFVPDKGPDGLRWAGPSPTEAADIWFVEESNAKSSFVDFQTDVTVADIALAARENYRSVEHLKRYTVLGMGVDQGKLGGVSGARIHAAMMGAKSGAAGPSKFRPPFSPVAFGLLGADYAGELFRPRRFLPAHDWHVRCGALFEDFGWERPAAYPLAGEDLHAAAQREAALVRTGVGLLDGSPLGKIVVAGPEAGEFLDRVYVGSPSTLKIGRVRYGLVLNEQGTIVDDGVYARIGKNEYLLSPSSAYADRMVGLLDELLQCEWPMDVLIHDQTEELAVWTLAGPRARDVLLAMQPDFDVSREAFPHLSLKSGRLGDVPVRVQRVSFSGELSFEVQLPARHAAEMGDALMQAGSPYGIVPYGIEALEILRIEKGYIHVGTDTDSETQPADIGFGVAIARKQSDFLGRRALERKSSASPDRRQLVGLKADGPAVLPPGAHLRAANGESEGFVTSSAYSVTLGRGVALALVRGGQSRHGEQVEVFSLGQRWRATIENPVALDPAGKRLDG